MYFFFLLLITMNYFIFIPMFKKLILSVLSGFFLFISWPPTTNFTFLIFISLVPLLIIELGIKRKED